MRRGVDGVARGQLPMGRLITHRFPLDDIQTAFDMMLTGRDGYIKGVIEP